MKHKQPPDRPAPPERLERPDNILSSFPIIKRIRDRAKALNRRIVFPEGTESRTLRAAQRLVADNITRVTLLGPKDKIQSSAGNCKVKLEGITLEDPLESSFRDQIVSAALVARKEKGLTQSQAEELVNEPLLFAALMVREGIADGSVAGAVESTADVLKAGIQMIGMSEGIESVSACFLIATPTDSPMKGRNFVFADSGVIPDPSAEQLVTICRATASTARVLLEEEPRIALLSFSTKGSAEHARIDKMRRALDLIQENAPELNVDGELQLDAAIIPDVAARKAPGSAVAGQANVLIFPDLDSANIGYKLAERFGGASATGPIVQGLAKPAHDLSRGCESDDIMNMAAIAAILSAGAGAK